MRIAVRYRPADHRVGGDWYDLFPLPGGRIGIVIGDVVGHDLPAAVTMGRLQTALHLPNDDDIAPIGLRLGRAADTAVG